MPWANPINDLGCQTGPNARIDAKGLFAAVANLPPLRSLRRGRASQDKGKLQASGSTRTATADSKKPNSNQQAKTLQRRHFAVGLGRGDVGYIDQVDRTYSRRRSTAGCSVSLLISRAR